MTRYYMSNGVYDLDVLVDDDADLDGSFDAVCVETGETLRINGWLIEELAVIPVL